MRFNSLSITSSLFLVTCLLASLIHTQNSSFQSYSKNFSSQILGSGATVTILKQVKLPLFHEAAVYFPPTKSLFITSDYINDPSINSNKSTVLISRVSGLDHPANVTVETINAPDIPFPNSGYRYITSRNGKAATDNYLVYLGQGNSLNDPPGGVFFLNALPPYNATNLIATYGKFPFNSPNDVTVAKDGSIWFTDPLYGSEYGNRPTPILPNQVYRFQPKDGSIRAMADGFGRPNGIAFSADQKTLYVGDTGALVGNGTIDTTGPRTIYAFDVMGDGVQGGPFLSNRRLFAMPDNQAPDGIKTDTKGNVYAGCGDGVNVWSPGGTLVGRILLEGGIGNLGFGEAGELFAMGNQVLWKINLDKAVLGATAN